VIFITHNVSHALPIGDTFTILSRGRTGGQFNRGEVDEAQLHSQMGGGDELHELTRELEALAHAGPAAPQTTAPPAADAPGSAVTH
jgi:simple sugar transport system ATP-binding protein